MEQKNFKIDFAGSTFNAWYVKEQATAEQILRELNEKDCIFGIDTETQKSPQFRALTNAALSPHLSTIRLLQIFDGKNTIIFDFNYINCSRDFITFLSTHRFIGHNSIFDLQYFLKLGVPEMNLGCTRILWKLISQAYYPTDSGLDASLGALVSKVLKIDINKEHGASDWSVPDLTFEQITYAALDPIYVMLIAEKLASGVEKYGLKRIYALSKAAQLPLACMQLNGLAIDVEAHKKLITHWRDEAHEAKKKVLNLTGLNDVTSSKIAGWLETHLPKNVLTIWPKTPTGKLSTDAHAFADFSYLDVVEPMSEFQKATTLCSTFGQALIDKINPATKRIHARYNICGARTGRLSSAGPNLQNLPRKKEVREIFIANEGKSFIRADYSQIELRVAAELSGDRAMLWAYKEGIDLHRLTASRIRNKKLEEVTDDDRQIAKAFNFGLLFGLGATKFSHYAKKSYGVAISHMEALRSIEVFRETYAGYREWQLTQAENAKKSLTVTTPCGKRRRLPEDETFGNSMNHPVQGGAAEIMLSALVRLEKTCRKKGWELLNTVHDEVVIEVTEGAEKYASDLVNIDMECAYREVFPNGIINKLVGIGSGKNWAEAK